MKKYFSLYILALVFSQLNAQTNIQIEITNLKSNNGFVMLELLDANEKNVDQKKSPIIDGKCTITFSKIAEGEYAIRYYHDENANEELDTNLIGIPKEGYGFSNDAYGRYGPKDFKEWLFNARGETKITLRTEYL